VKAIATPIYKVIEVNNQHEKTRTQKEIFLLLNLKIESFVITQEVEKIKGNNKRSWQLMNR
jgi:hypothetical protein